MLGRSAASVSAPGGSVYDPRPLYASSPESTGVIGCLCRLWAVVTGA